MDRSDLHGYQLSIIYTVVKQLTDSKRSSDPQNQLAHLVSIEDTHCLHNIHVFHNFSIHLGGMFLVMFRMGL